MSSSPGWALSFRPEARRTSAYDIAVRQMYEDREVGRAHVATGP